MPDKGNVVRNIYGCRICAALTPDYDIAVPLDIKSQIKFHEKWWCAVDPDALQQELSDLIGVVGVLKPHLGAPGPDRRVLEIGAGRGGLLKALRDVGYAAHGCEPATNLVAIAREHYGLSADILANIDADAMLASVDHVYDIAILWHIIEHLSNPLDIMRRVSQIIAPDGAMIIQVPLLRQIYTYREHYYFCSHDTLSYIASQIGFGLAEVIYDEEHLFVTAVFRRDVGPDTPAFLDCDPVPDPLSQILLLNERSKLAYGNMIRDCTIGMAAWENLAKERLTALTAMEKLIDSGVEAMAIQAAMIDQRDLDIKALQQKLAERDLQ